MGDILDELEWRGLLAQSTDPEALRKALHTGPVTLYCGFDPTAASLHAGHLAQILTLLRFQRAGHRPIALVGGATGLIGDPSFRSVERALNDVATVEEWVRRIGRQLQRFFDFDSGRAILADNLDWTHGLSAIELLRDVGKHFSVNQMLQKESVRARLEGPGISFTEFSYTVLQAYDYLQLYRRYGCTLQIGGSDQWGNITAGADLIRRVAGVTAHALTTALLTRDDGSKFGKTAGGDNIWLDAELTSPYAFYQFWIGADDRKVGTFLRVFSLHAPDEIEELEKQVAEHPSARAAQRALAAELTTLVHGAAECARVEQASRALFGHGALEELDERTVAAALAEVPHTTVGPSVPPVVELMVQTGLAASKSAARRTVAEGGAYLNNRRISEAEALPTADDLLHGRFLVLRRGRRAIAGVDVVRT
ncbi:MAG: tyrosine--tRNA ligase [Streptosporangiaceae bacterium]